MNIDSNLYDFAYRGAKNKPYLNTQQLVKFFNDEQRDPRLNEILFPFADPKKAKELVDQFEPNKAFAKKGWFPIPMISFNFFLC